MKYLNLIFVIIIPFFCYSQENENKIDEPTHYLFDGKVSFSGFGAPIYEFSGISNNFAFSKGGGGAALLNQSFFFGGYGMNLSTDFIKNIVTVINDSVKYKANYRFNMNHGGFWIGYIYNSKQLVHFCISTKIGWGRVAFSESKMKMEKKYDKYANNIFVLSPQIEAELNILRWMKLNFGFGYRFVTGSDAKDDAGNEVYGINDFSSPIVSFSVHFGLFGKKQPTVKNVVK